MTDLFQHLALGFGVALTPVNLLYCFVGVVVGTAIGVLPGIGPVTTVAMLVPLTFGMNPTAALIMLAGIYYGSQYGGSTTAILINTPGETSSVMTCLDGYQMARQGRAGPALGMAAIGSFVAGTLSVVLLMLLARPLVRVALEFGPAEYFAIMLLALLTLGGLTGESVTKGLLMAAFGLLLGTIGGDPMTGTPRFTFGVPSLLDGLEFLPVTIGLFAVAEVLTTATRSLTHDVYAAPIRGLLPSRADWRACRWTLPRASLIGFVVGVLPGAGATLASIIAYLTEKRLSRHPERFGTGVIEGVAAPETANNAASGGAMVPLLTLGVPGSGTTAVMLGALMLWGLRPGPLLFEKNPELVWGLIASMYIGNVLLLILNLPLIGLLGAAPVGAAAYPDAPDSPVLLHGHLRGQREPLRPVGDGDLRDPRLRAPALRLPGRSDRAGAHPGADARDALPAGPDHLPRGLRHLPPAPDRGRAHRGRGRVPGLPVLGGSGRGAAGASGGPSPSGSR